MAESGWYETYRGAVAPWECDTVDHFTVAFYFDRFSDATLGLMDEIGVGPSYMQESGRSCATMECLVGYRAELRAGDLLHIEGAPIGVEGKRLRLGHKVINSVTGEVCATLEQSLVHFDMKARKSAPFPDRLRESLAAQVVPWDGPAREERPAPKDESAFMQSYRDVAKPQEMDLNGHIGFQFFIHRFSAATGQVLAAAGMTPAYCREATIGFSTFEFQLAFHRELHAGDRVAVRSALMHVGGSSLRILNRMYNLGTGELAASLSQFGVHLDMKARRPSRIPDEIRARAAHLLAEA